LTTFPVWSKNLRARLEPTQVEPLSDASFLGQLLVLTANVRVGWKGIARDKCSSLFSLNISYEEKKYSIDTGCQSYKTFFSPSLTLQKNKLECLYL
jgi:hypothetical protein